MMKLRKALSAVVLGTGCAAAFTGLLAVLLPAIANDQLRLVLSSFEMPSQNPVVSAMNGCMSFALNHAWQVLLLGLLTAVIGGILFSLFLREPPRKARQDLYRRPSHVPRPQPPQPEPEPKSQPNPFADLALWDRSAVAEEESLFERRPPVFNPTPILEPNRIAEAEPDFFRPEPAPTAHRSTAADAFETERRAMETSLTPPSQSGRSAILRSTFETPAPEPEPVPEPVPVQAAAPIIPAPEDPYADDPRFEPNEEEPPPPPPVSSRIRSTMGKHS